MPEKHYLIASVLLAGLGLIGLLYREQEAPPGTVSVVKDGAPAVVGSRNASAPVQSTLPLPVPMLEPRQITAINGRPVNTEGLPVAEFLGKYAIEARRGNAAVAYRLYQAESMCAQRAFREASLSITQGIDAVQRAAETDLIARMNEACTGVSPEADG